MDWYDNYVSLHVNFIEWHDYYIIIYFPHSKGYQEGVNNNDPWNVYSNPLYPEICPVLDSSNYVLAYPTLFKGGCRLFPGYFQYNGFMNMFRGVLKEHKNEFVALIVDVSDLVSHSAHKGAATLCASGCTF